MSNIKELIREKIDAFYTEYKAKFHQNGDSYHLGIIDGLDMAERILDTLPDEPETDCNDLEEAAEKSAGQYYVDGGYSPFPNIETESHIAGFISGAKWMKKQMPMPEDTVLFQKGVEEGKRLMMEGAVEEEVQEVYRDDDGIHCCVSVGTDYKPGTIVYVITIPKEGAEQ